MTDVIMYIAMWSWIVVLVLAHRYEVLRTDRLEDRVTTLEKEKEGKKP